MGWRLEPEKTGVVIIDVQEKLLPAIAGSDRITAKAAQIARVAGVFGLPVFLTEQAPQKLGRTVAPVRSALPGCTPIPKTAFSAAEVLPPGMPKCLLLAGIETHVCLRQTVYDLRARDHTIYVLADAAGSRSPMDHDIALAEMQTDDVLIASVESVSWELLRSADNPLFGQVLDILK